MKYLYTHINLKWICLVSLALLSMGNIAAQSVKLQVVTKHIDKKMKYTQGQVLTVKGEKSEVDIMTWEEDYISISLDLKAQHPETNVATEDLNKFEYEFKNTPDTLFITNRIIEKEETLRSGMQAFYTIKIPESCKVKLDNYFGTAVLTDLSQGVDIKSEFCNLKLKNVGGEVNVNTYFGDLIGVMINGDVDIRANRSNITLTEIEGKFNIDAYMGVVKVFANQSILDLNINAVKSDVFFYDSQLDDYNFNLTSRLGDIEVPSDLNANYTRENDLRNIIVKPQGELNGVKVAINVVSGDIMLGSR